MKIIIWILTLFVFQIQLIGQSMEVIVHFNFNEHTIPDSSVTKLKKVMRDQQYLSATLEGHCDSVGNHTYNQLLSERRVYAVALLLMKNGLASNQIIFQKGYGKRRPLTPNKTEKDRLMNRRVVVKFFDYIIAEVSQDKLTDFDFDQLKSGENIIIPNVLFEPGRHILKEESFKPLEKVWQLMMDHPTLEIEIQGHICCTTTEPDGYDQDTERENLSEERAYAIYSFLIQNGIEEYR